MLSEGVGCSESAATGGEVTKRKREQPVVRFVDAPAGVIPVHDASTGRPVSDFAACERLDTAGQPAHIRAVLNMPQLLRDGRPNRVVNGMFAVEDQDRFRTKFREFTDSTFERFEAEDWANVVVAGGAVVACLQADPPSVQMRGHARLRNADVDMFLFGLNERQARSKVEQIFLKLKSTPGCTGAREVLAMRTPHTMTVVLPSPKRLVQIVLNLHESAEQIVESFDVDVCGCYFDGTGVYATRRAARAFATRVLVATPERRSWTFETRLIKYAKRGFSIAVPGLRVSDIQLKEKREKRTRVCDLPKDHPDYQPRGSNGSWKSVVTGHYYAFPNSYSYGEQEGGDSGPTVVDYIETEGCRKLLIADAAGRSQFKSEGRSRTKFIPNDVSTFTAANAIIQEVCDPEDPYGPPDVLPDVPGKRKYAVNKCIKNFLRGSKESDHYVTFVDGPIPTGVAAGFHTPLDWFKGCYGQS